MINLIVTTAGRTDSYMIEQAKGIAKDLESTFMVRNKTSISELQSRINDDFLVVGKSRLELYVLNGKEPLFFHPNSAMFRLKRIIRGEDDPFLEATKLQKGMTFLDCTIGLGSDCIVASFITGQTGSVIGIEGNRYLSYLVATGLKTWDTGIPEINAAMQTIEVIYSEHLDYLRSSASNSIDVVYFDPMFEENIAESKGIEALKKVAIYRDLSFEIIEEARRVAKNRIVLKDHWKSERFIKFGFKVNKRKTSKFHFGVLNLL